MYLLKFNHREFDKYAEDKLHAIINIADVVRFLDREPLTVASLSKRINPPEELARGRSKYDIYGVIDKLERWGYVIKDIDEEKYGNTRKYWLLTDAGRELLSLLPKYLSLGELAYRKAYMRIQKSGRVS